MAKNKNNKKVVQVDPYFILGLYNNNHANGGFMEGPGDPPPTNDIYTQQLDEYNQASNFLKGAGQYKGVLIDPKANPDLYKPSASGLVPKNVFQSNLSDSAYFYEYDKPINKPAPVATTPTAPKQPQYLDPHTKQPLPADVYGTPQGSEDVQFSQGAELESRKLSNLQKGDDRQAVMENNKKLLGSMSEEQKADMRSLKLTPAEYLSKFNSDVVQQFAYGGSIELADEQTLQGTVPQYSHVNVKGETGKGALSGALTGAATGATMGSVIPGWGTAVGAVVGAVAGGITGGIKKKKAAEAMQEQDQLAYEQNNAMLQENGDEVIYRAMGGPLSVDNIEGPRHDDGGIEMAKAEVEGGEAKLGDYIFSDRLKPKGSKRTFAQVAKGLEFKYRDRDNDTPAMKSKARELESLMAENEMSRKEAEQKEALINNSLQADAFAYGGKLKRNDGGAITYDAKDHDLFKNLSKNKQMDHNEYINKVFALGGNLNNDGNPPYAEATMLDVEQQPLVDNQYQEDVLSNLNSGLTLSNDYSDPAYEGIDMSFQDDYNNETPTEEKKKFQFGNEEAALLASSLGNVDNLLASGDNAQTRFNRVNPSLVSLENQRENIDSDISMARGIARENIRGNATSSGQALSNLAAANASLTQQKQRALGESYANEANANSQILNQNRGINAQIGNEETIANEQNKDLRRALQNKAITDESTNIQMYLKDKKMTSENKRQNERVVDVINSLGYNYKWEDDNGKLALKFMNLLDKQKGTE